MSKSAIVVHPDFDIVWPFAADHMHRLWKEHGDVQFVQLADGDTRPVHEVLDRPEEITRLAAFCANVTAGIVDAMPLLREATITGSYGFPEGDAVELLKQRGVKLYRQLSEGFWGQSVSEFGLALTLCGLRRIPQTHRNILSRLDDWDYSPPNNLGRPGARGQQYGDDSRFTNGTVHGKRIRIVGAGNIASRYASFVHMLGADVAVWDPYASEPSFHRAGSRRVHHLNELMRDADIFVPMVPLTDSTAGLVTADHIEALPTGCLVVLVTRAGICDMKALRRRVLADQLSLAADVFDVEPLPLSDPLLGRHNVVHTPHNAGRTIHANEQYAQMLADQFEPYKEG